MRILFSGHGAARPATIAVPGPYLCTDPASYLELVRVVRARQDAGLDFDAIQAVVYSLSPNAMVGTGNAERLGVDAVGGRNKPFLRINNGGREPFGQGRPVRKKLVVYIEGAPTDYVLVEACVDRRVTMRNVAWVNVTADLDNVLGGSANPLVPLHSDYDSLAVSG